MEMSAEIKMEVWRASGCRHFLRGPSGAIGSSSTSKQVNTSLWLSVHRVWRAKLKVCDSVADPGCLSMIRIFSIPDPYFFHPVSWILIAV
jgi:hypothetical protein